MPRQNSTHVVCEGECVLAIARAAGAPWRKLWDHEANARLREQGRTPTQVEPGDEVFVPEVERREESGPTEARHRFVTNLPRALLRLRLLQRGEPRANLAYRLQVAGFLREGVTDADGRLEEVVRADVREAVLTLAPGTPDEERVPLLLGGMGPLVTTRGVKARLQNLGLFPHPLDGSEGDGLESAVRAFQEQEGLRVTGRVDEATRDALRTRYGG
jgi:hypothetical protein